MTGKGYVKIKLLCSVTRSFAMAQDDKRIKAIGGTAVPPILFCELSYNAVVRNEGVFFALFGCA